MKALWLIIIVFWFAACAKPAGGPLSHTFDNTRIASVALESKQAVTEAQQQYDLAVAQHRKADEAYADSGVEQDVAAYQAERAVLVSQLVATRMNDKAQASTDTATLARQTAGAKVAFMGARRQWLEKLASSTLYAVYAAQAKLELERAKVAQAGNLNPAGFEVTTFEAQFAQRDRAAQTAAAGTEKERQAAEARLIAWNELERSFMQASNMKTPSESDRAVTDWKQAAAPPPPPAEAPVSASAPPPSAGTPAAGAAAPPAKP